MAPGGRGAEGAVTVCGGEFLPQSTPAVAAGATKKAGVVKAATCFVGPA